MNIVMIDVVWSAKDEMERSFKTLLSTYRRIASTTATIASRKISYRAVGMKRWMINVKVMIPAAIHIGDILSNLVT